MTKVNDPSSGGGAALVVGATIGGAGGFTLALTVPELVAVERISNKFEIVHPHDYNILQDKGSIFK